VGPGKDAPAPDPFLPLARSGIRPGLSRIRRLLNHMGNPQRRMRTVLVAGSNGKGTTAAMLEAMLRAAGFHTGLFTSPHLVSVTERFRINGARVKQDELQHFMRRFEPAIRRTGATYFEATTACAIWLFARHGVQWAVLEIGLGGRWDACNATDPEVSIITSISREHTDYLGTTEVAIAREKAQVARSGKPVIVGRVSSAVRSALGAEFRKLKAVPYWVGREFDVVDARYHRAGVSGALTGDGKRLHLTSAIRGKNALDNAALAACALAAVAGVVRSHSAAAVRKAIVAGARAVRWPGRLEVACKRPLVVLDVAHNPASFEALALDWRRHWPGVRPIVVVGLLADKNPRPIGRALAEIAKSILLTTPESPRAASPSELARLWQQRHTGISIIPEVGEAVRSAVKAAGPKGAVLIAGSHFVVGPARQVLRPQS